MTMIKKRLIFTFCGFGLVGMGLTISLIPDHVPTLILAEVQRENG